MDKDIRAVEAALEKYIPFGDREEQILLDSVRGGSDEAAMPFACAVEMVHTYSLIHDDMPCMDDDDFRRGKPANHKVYGEDIALLAGDALQSMAYDAMLCDDTLALVGGDRAARAACVLAKKSGVLGMVGGQTIDLSIEHRSVGIDTVRSMEEKKTANLIEAACMMGCIAAGGTDEQIAAAERYAHSIGLAFQIVDDILDVTSTAEELGKPIGSDAGNEKNTFMSLWGLERCREAVDKLTNEAIEALGAFDGDTTQLADFAKKLANRRK